MRGSDTTAVPLLDDTFAQLMANAAAMGDIPAFSQSARSILNALAADSDNDFDLVQSVLADTGLTQRVLRLANSAMYNVFGGEVSTVTRAIQVLGVQTVAHLALGLKVIDSVDRGRPESAATLAEMQKSVLAGFMGRQLAGHRGSLKDTETATVIAILMGLGRMMVCFYLPQVWASIQTQVAAKVPEGAAVRDLLGGTFADIGQRMASHWGLPATLTNNLQPRTPWAGQTHGTHDEWLQTLATAATEGARILHAEPADPETALGALAGTFSAALGLEPAAMLGALRAGKAAARDHFAEAPAALVRPLTDGERQARLLRGCQELQEAAKTAPLTQLLAMALEYLHANFGARRSLAFLLFAKDKRYRARFGLGAGAAALLPELHFDSRFQPDVFHAVLPNEKALFVQNARADNIRAKLPAWWLATLGSAHSLCIVPLHMNGASVGFLYLDWAPPTSAPPMDAARMQILSEVREILVRCMARPRPLVAAVSAV